MVLVLFQLQVFAAASLGCLHADGADGVASVCPYHLADQDQGQSDAGVSDEVPGALDCTKCALTLGLHAVPGAVPALPVLVPRSPIVATQACHFYRHAPDSYLRPPIHSFA
jgi:hypothetical protein